VGSPLPALLFSPPSFRAMLDGDASFYSAFCKSSATGQAGECSLVVAGAVVTSSEALSEQKGASCKLWYEGSSQAFEGVFSASVEAKGKEMEATVATIHCENKNPSRLPRAVTIRASDGRIRPHIGSYHTSFSEELTLPVEYSFAIDLDESPTKDSAAACLIPAEDGQDRREDLSLATAETILLSSLAGIKNFLVYEPASSHKLLRILRQAIREADPQLRLHLLPWDPPAGAETAAMAVAKADCFLRARAHWETVLTLRPGRVVAPGGGAESLQASLSAVGAGAGLHSLSVRRHCSELPASADSEHHEFSIVALEQTEYDVTASASEPPADLLTSRRGDLAGEGEILSPATLAVMDFSSCGRYDFKRTATDFRLAKRADVVLRTFGRFFPRKQV